ncbi:hypothetical protein KFZ70_07025 [Tamlana fucoidanivorans]|uniref:Uncharacterized protein n=1 Tax=Allotamlana fucoidanivorans TaxID=2583814 RepID=A0A5C4SN60_9FLAO|nr:hypothetical protein [Tamlana fucoidanivorans]TNJ45238.1 hypothetical protein FGF67_05885 [Tamlana fucoidanivorans]
MDRDKNIQNQIDETINVSERIQKVSVSAFFKDKTMQVLFADKKEEESRIWLWFTPKLQLASLVCIIILNVIAYTRMQQATYDHHVSQFAESYGLSTPNQFSLLK